MRSFQLLSCVLLAVISLPALTWTASAVTIAGVEFTDWTSVEAPAGAHIELSTDGDIYVYAPDSIDFDSAVLTAFTAIVLIDVELNTNNPMLCTTGCSSEVYELSGDVVLSIFEPVGDLILTTTASMVLARTLIPEPSTALLLVTGLSLIPVWGRARTPG